MVTARGNCVLPGLYVGNYRDSKDAVQLDRFNITHIVAIHDSARKIHPDKHYLCVLASDTVEQNLAQFLAGMSRSVTVTIAYIMSVTSLNWKEALKVVRVGRAIANPNNGFQKQLQDFECFRLADERRRLRERFPSRALASMDEEQCQLLLIAYQGLLSGKHICEGNCAMGEICPTGMCRASRSRRRLRERFPSRALASMDEEQCQLLLIAYQGLLSGKHICEGNCAMGEICPTGMCRASRSRTNRRKTSSTSLQNFACASSSSSSSHLTRSNSTLSPKRRPSSSPSKLSGSAPASPKSSVLDLSIYPETPEDSHSLLATLSLPSCSSAPPSPHPRTSSSQKLLRKISLHRTS
ncbi:uncharacterized protein LOC103513724 [Diaphorina citri]|uniref:Uncharacterized protein LOC103513724 n=1 Tax=Diaphorina citri TaxID=121845 RepID=A0A3Q0J216_DIACI|nr:uncharacterized protein LOC103513724 [Diaphorina citri]